jgi:hypothetical protein
MPRLLATHISRRTPAPPSHSRPLPPHFIFMEINMMYVCTIRVALVTVAWPSHPCHIGQTISATNTVTPHVMSTSQQRRISMPENRRVRTSPTSTQGGGRQRYGGGGGIGIEAELKIHMSFIFEQINPIAFSVGESHSDRALCFKGGVPSWRAVRKGRVWRGE